MNNINLQEANSISIQYEESWNEMEMQTHYHNSYEIIYVAAGKVLFKINNRKYEVHSGSMIFISHLETHEFAVIQYPYKRYFILIKPEYFNSVINEPKLASLFKHRPRHFSHIIRIEESSKSRLEEYIKRMYEEACTRKEFHEIKLGSQLQLLFVDLYRDFKENFPLNSLNSSMRTVIQIQKYIDEHYLEHVNLKDVSKLFFMDMYYLSHLFRKVTGFTFKEYLILQRISKAKEKLVYSDDDITSISLDSGFGNVNHFIRIFRKIEGTTPYQYRKKQREVPLKTDL